MFFREKKTKYASYLQLVESKRVDGKPRQKVVMTLGKIDETGQALKALDSILLSGAKFSQTLAVLSDHRLAEVPHCKRKIDARVITAIFIQPHLKQSDKNSLITPQSVYKNDHR